MTPAAIITGGATRIGRDMAIHLAGRGYDIAFTFNRSAQEAESLQAAIEEQGQRALPVQCDLTHTSVLEQLISRICDEMPDARILINNASVFQPGTIDQTTLDTLRHNMALHAEAPFVLTRDFARYFKSGLVVNMLDQRIVGHENTHAAYLLSKQTLASLTGMAALEFAPDIRVNALALGAILPPSGEAPEATAHKTAKIPAGRYGSVEDLLPALDLLIDNSFITGQTIYIDGGERL